MKLEPTKVIPLFITSFSLLLPSQTALAQTTGEWRHLSSKQGDITPPNGGDQQTSSSVFKIDDDDINDFVITERTKAPSVLWYKYTTGNWRRYISINEHEGLDLIDIDLDDTLDIVGGGRWFKHIGNLEFKENIIDAGYAFSRSAAGQLVEGGRPEVVLVVGDGKAPIVLYEYQNKTWHSKILVDEVDNGHSLAIIDFNNDGYLDIWNAEMRLNNGNPDAKNRILLGDGQGNFEELIVSTGIGLHESKIADLDGDGDLDILGKPYNWDAPRLDIWINTTDQAQ
ncbi:MAG: VCBS repeat-containing protein [Verrucomicrobia bacterium]|nr:VCBS repeat-containing protein [Verrucomicrobiota bacterium]MCF7707686.1 VCBS repeat-containing protein [Verrucomicrobiota bacterium]